MVATSAVGVLLVLCTVLGLALSAHFMGAIIQWRPLSIGNSGAVTVQSTRSRRKKGCVIPTWECLNNYFL